MKAKGMNQKDKIDKLIEAIEDVYPSDKKLMWKSFLRGVFTALGATVGLSLVIGLLTLLLNYLRVFPAVDRLIEDSKVEKILPE